MTDDATRAALHAPTSKHWTWGSDGYLQTSDDGTSHLIT